MKNLYPDILYIIASKCDTVSLINLTLASRENLLLYTPILKERLQLDDSVKKVNKTTPLLNFSLNLPNLSQGIPGVLSVGLSSMMQNSRKVVPTRKQSSKNNIEIFHDITSKYFHSDHIVLYKELNIVVDNWDTLILYNKRQLNFIYSHKLYNIESIVKSSSKIDTSSPIQVKKKLEQLPKYFGYNIWYNLFNSDIVLPKQILLTHLTNFVFDNFRDDLIINNKFIMQCFKRKLDKIIIFIYEYKKFLCIELRQNESLERVLLKFAADYDNMDIFSSHYLNTHIDSVVIEYCIHYAPYDFLLSLWKFKNKVPIDVDFSRIIQDFKPQNKKQMEYIKWCKKRM